MTKKEFNHKLKYGMDRAGLLEAVGVLYANRHVEMMRKRWNEIVTPTAYLEFVNTTADMYKNCRSDYLYKLLEKA